MFVVGAHRQVTHELNWSAFFAPIASVIVTGGQEAAHIAQTFVSLGRGTFKPEVLNFYFLKQQGDKPLIELSATFDSQHSLHARLLIPFFIKSRQNHLLFLLSFQSRNVRSI